MNIEDLLLVELYSLKRVLIKYLLLLRKIIEKLAHFEIYVGNRVRFVIISGAVVQELSGTELLLTFFHVVQRGTELLLNKLKTLIY